MIKNSDNVCTRIKWRARGSGVVHTMSSKEFRLQWGECAEAVITAGYHQSIQPSPTNFNMFDKPTRHNPITPLVYIDFDQPIAKNTTNTNLSAYPLPMHFAVCAGVIYYGAARPLKVFYHAGQGVNDSMTWSWKTVVPRITLPTPLILLTLPTLLKPYTPTTLFTRSIILCRSRTY